MAAVMGFAVNGGTDIDLLDGVNYQALADWVPRVATRRRGRMGGNIYDAVVETIPVRVTGSSVTAVLDALHNLTAVLDQAQRWYDAGGVGVGAVTFKYQPDGSTLTNPLQAAVLGAPDNASDLLSLRPRFDRTVGAYKVFADLQFIRHGRLLADEESDDSGAAVANPSVMTCTFSDDLSIPAPYNLEISFDNPVYSAEVQNGIVVASDDSNGIKLVEAEDYAGYGGWEPVGPGTVSTIADSDASGGNYVRITADAQHTQLIFSAPSGFTPGIFGVYASVRNNGATGWRIRPGVYSRDGLGIPRIFGGEVLVSSDTSPTWVYLGAVPVPDNWSGSYNIVFQPTIVGSDTIDVDTFCFVDVLRCQAVTNVETFLPSGTTRKIAINHQLLTKPQPRVYGQSDLEYPFIEWQGAGLMSFGGNTLIAALLCASGGHWRLTGGTSTVFQHVLTATRRPAYLVPQ